MSSSRLTLYTTSHCHMCEQALAMLHALDLAQEIELIEITHSDELIECYGTRIPVLQRADDAAELGWPFSKEELQAWLIPDFPLSDFQST